MEDNHPITSIHCLGDSITECQGLPENGRWTALLQQQMDGLQSGRYAVYNHGVGGDTSAMGLERMRKETIGKGITFIQFGLNDCSCRGFSVKNRVGLVEYVDNLRAMAAIVRLRGGQPVLIANHLLEYANEIRQNDGQLYSEKVRIYNDAVRSVATEMDTPLIDMEVYFRAPEQLQQKLRADGLHLNIAGNRVYAARVFEFLANRLKYLRFMRQIA